MLIYKCESYYLLLRINKAPDVMYWLVQVLTRNNIVAVGQTDTALRFGSPCGVNKVIIIKVSAHVRLWAVRV